VNGATQADPRAQHARVDWQQTCAQMDDLVARQGAPYATAIGPSGHRWRRWRWRVTVPLGRIGGGDTEITAYQGSTFTREGAQAVIARYNGTLRVGELVGRGLVAVTVGVILLLLFAAAHLPAVFGAWAVLIVAVVLACHGVGRVVRGLRVVYSAEDTRWTRPRE
jgi:hypothetical protein